MVALTSIAFRTGRHLPALWFAGLANQLFWWTYAKAMWRSFTAACCCSGITFKATAKVGDGFSVVACRAPQVDGVCLARLPGLMFEQNAHAGCTATGRQQRQQQARLRTCGSMIPAYFMPY